MSKSKYISDFTLEPFVQSSESVVIDLFKNKIDMNRKNVEKFINNVFSAVLLDFKYDPPIELKKIPLHTVNETIDNHPCIFVYGGSAYDVYDKYLSNQNGKLFDYSPRPYDYDVRFVATKITDENIMNVQKYLTMLFKDSYKILNHNNFITDNFIDLNEETLRGKLPENETIVEIINNKVLLSKYKHPKYSTTNFRISLFISKDDTIHGDHVYEFVISEDDEKTPNSLILLPNVSFPVPDIVSLFKLTFISVFGRALFMDKYTKCFKDVVKLKYFFNLLNIQNQDMLIFLGFKTTNSFVNLANFLKYVIDFVPYCDTNKYDKTNIVHFILTQHDTYTDENGNKSSIKDEILKILSIVLNNINDSDAVNEEISRLKHMKTYIESINEKSKFLNKYKKYKNKYLQLKNKYLQKNI